MTRPKDLAPGILRQRLLIEAHWGLETVTAQTVRDYLIGLAARLELRPYGEPVVFSPASGDGRPENAGFDAFVPLVDSGISGYFWIGPRFLSVVLYTCKGFDEAAAVDFTRAAFRVDGELVAFGF